MTSLLNKGDFQEGRGWKKGYRFIGGHHYGAALAGQIRWYGYSIMG
jgi:hypothetical protein